MIASWKSKSAHDVLAAQHAVQDDIMYTYNELLMTCHSPLGKQACLWCIPTVNTTDVTG